MSERDRWGLCVSLGWVEVELSLEAGLIFQRTAYFTVGVTLARY